MLLQCADPSWVCLGWFSPSYGSLRKSSHSCWRLPAPSERVHTDTNAHAVTITQHLNHFATYRFLMLFVFTSSSSHVLAARKKQAMAMQRRYFGRAWRATSQGTSVLHRYVYRPLASTSLLVWMMLLLCAVKLLSWQAAENCDHFVSRCTISSVLLRSLIHRWL